MIKKIKILFLSSTSKDTFVTLIGNGLVAAAGMFFTIIAARSLAPEKFGVMSALFAIASLFGSMSDMGISSALINFIPKLPNKRNTIIATTFWMQLAIGLALTLIVLGFIPFKNTIVPGSDIVHLLILALLILVLAFETFAQSILKAEKRFTLSAIVMALDSVIKFLITLALFFNQTVTITSTLLAALAASSLATAIAISGELKTLKPIFPKKLAGKIFKFAKWIAVMRAFSVAISRVDVILLNAIGGSYQAGIYAAASRIALLFAILVSSLGSVVAPRFSSFNNKDQVKAYLKKISILISFVAAVMTVTVLFAPLIINLVFGEEYVSAIPVFRSLTFAMIPFLLSIITTNPLIYSFNKPKLIANICAPEFF